MALQSTVASIQNIRKQRQLEMELVELERLWHLELKALARERLGLIKELCRIRQDQRGADHFPPHCAHVHDLTHFADTAQARLRRVKEAKELRKYDFQPDPVEKMHLHLPLLPTRDQEVVEVRTAKELYQERVSLQKSNVEQCTADRRSRRRPFWDKALLGSKKRQQHHHQQHGHHHHPQDRLVSFPVRIRSLGPPDQVLQDSQRIAEEEQAGDLRRREGLSKSPSLPALNSLRRFDSLKPSKIHPSLSSRHSASLDYLPVIKSTPPRGQHAVLPPLKAAAAAAPSVASSVTTLPTIEET